MEITKCRWCGSSNIKFTETSNLIHYGRYDCKNCNKFVGWVRNPLKEENNRSRKLDVKEVCEFHGYKEEFCFFCLRNRNQLGVKETLTVDHINERAKDGEDSIRNFQVLCTACHKLKNWARLYTNWHLNKEDKDEPSI